MSVAAVLPLKSLPGAKQRLAGQLTSGPRQALVEAMFADVLVALRRCERVSRIIVVSADHGAQRLAGGYGADVLDDDDSGHSRAALRGVARARELGLERVLLVPGDCPLLDAADVDALLARPPDPPRVLVVPDRHGTGTNALLLAPPDAISPAFGEGSCARHQQIARAAGVAAEVVPVATLALDVDTPEDLEALHARLAQRRGGAARTRGMLNQILRSRAG
jgi:2-phospho-L-lactate guanylyltransferase